MFECGFEYFCGMCTYDGVGQSVRDKGRKPMQLGEPVIVMKPCMRLPFDPRGQFNLAVLTRR